MEWSQGNIAYLALVMVGFCVFIFSVGYASWRTSRPEHRPQELRDEGPAPHSDRTVPPTPEQGLKVHGDKLSHSMDVAL